MWLTMGPTTTAAKDSNNTYDYIYVLFQCVNLGIQSRKETRFHWVDSALSIV